MNISFENLAFKVEKRKVWGKNEIKQILRGVNGEFRGCELTGIIGPSGSGKSTMLNILSGFFPSTESTIKVNQNVVTQKTIRFKSSYIMQEYDLHKFLTVRETMNFAMNLKVGKRLSIDQRRLKIEEILDSLGLLEILNHQCRDLSGGEQKRLSIAVELVDDPSILFLDEPTTGLDASSSTQCIQLLKKLAQQSKTVVCTIHSPSALLVEMFDHLYALADGSCIYQGSSKNIVPFLAELDLICPQIYSPCDFLLEIATNDYGPQNNRLSEKIQNGSLNDYRKSPDVAIQEDLNLQLPTDVTSSVYSTSLYQQFTILLIRNFLTNKRDKTLMLLRLLINVGSGLCFGCIYFGIGNDASFIFDIQKFVVYSIYHVNFLGFNSQLTTFPLELPMVKREHFNRWYSAGAYYLALTVVDIPALILNNFIFISIIYFMTDQPLEFFRIALYFLMVVLVGFTSQGLGILSGSITNIQHTLIIAAGAIFYFTLFSGFFVLMKDCSSYWHWMFYSSFLKHGLDGSFLAIFGYHRSKLDCEADYCHFRWPHKFLESLGINASYGDAVSAVIFSLFLFRIAAFFVIKYRLKH